MVETLPKLVENSFRIAWDSLEATDELANPDMAARHLLNTIEILVQQGERLRILLSNKAVTSYRVLERNRVCHWPHSAQKSRFASR
jgi:hypothetical protein